MGKSCSLCGEFISSIEAGQFTQFIKEKIASYGVSTTLKLDDSNKIYCEFCGKPFCAKCFQYRQYNGKSIQKYIEIFDPKFHTTAEKSFLADKYICAECAKLSASKHCYTCGKELSNDLEGQFSGRHVGMHLRCTKCDSMICLDCATREDNPLKFNQKCPYCNAKKWLPTKSELLLANYRKNIIYVEKRQGYRCKSCGDEKTIMLFCKRTGTCGDCYCPTCIQTHDVKNRGICPSCKKPGFRSFKKELPELAMKSISLPIGPRDVLDQEKMESELPEFAEDTIEKENQALSDVIEEIIPEQVVEDDLLGVGANLINSKKINDSDLEVSQEEYFQSDDSPQILEEFDLKEDLRRFVRITNMIEELQEFIQDFNFSIQFQVESAEKFYFYFNRGKMYGNPGVLPSPTLHTDELTLSQVKSILHGDSMIEMDFIHGNAELIDLFMDFHDVFDMVVHS